MRVSGIRAITHGSAGEYGRADKPELHVSLILDVELPNTNSLLQKQITDGDHPPIISTAAQAAREQKAGKCVPGSQGEVRVCVRGDRRRGTKGVLWRRRESAKRSQMQIDH